MIALETTNKQLIVEIDLGYICNYKCSYCGTFYNSGEKWLNIDKLKKFIDNTLPDVVTLVGGEPTIYPHITELLTYLHNKGIFIMIITNNSLPLSWWKKHMKFIDKVVASYHIEFANFDNFKENLEFINDYCIVSINFSMMHERFDECWDYINKLKNIDNLLISPKPLRNRVIGGLYPYNNEQLNRMAKPIRTKSIETINKKRLSNMQLFKVFSNGKKEKVLAQELIANKENSFKGWLCWKGIQTLKVQGDGNVYKATCELNNKRIHFKPIANINDTYISIPQTPVLCPKNWCYCIADLKYIRKEKI